MSGHSKWATIKHRKGAADKARGKLFARVLRQVEVAAREGGGDLDANPTLRTMYQKARDASIPTDTIDRAVRTRSPAITAGTSMPSGGCSTAARRAARTSARRHSATGSWT